MIATACALLRHDIRPRFIGDLVAAYCHSCGCLYVPEPVAAPVVEPTPAPAPPVLANWAPGELVEAYGR